MFESVFGRSFNAAKCKTLLRLAISRIKLLRNKRDIQLKQMRRELIQLLQTNQEPSARIRVEHIYREQNIMAAYEIIELFCELVVVRLPIIDSQRQCPIDLREAVASLIFAAPRCSDVPELLQVRNLLSAKYGKEFVIAAAELRPDCGVNRVVIEKLSVKAPPGDVKLKLMKDIAEEHNFDWDPSTSESELLKAPEDLLEGPTHFLGASQMAVETPIEQPSTVPESGTQQNEVKELQEPVSGSIKGEKQFIPFISPGGGYFEPLSKQPSISQATDSRLGDAIDRTEHSLPTLHSEDTSLGNDHVEDTVRSSASNRAERFKDVVAAAREAAESAERAAAAARAAASLASEKFDRAIAETSSESGDDVGDVQSDSEVRSPDKHQYVQRSSFNNRSSSGRPLFDEPEGGEEFGHASSFQNQRTIQSQVLGDDAQMGEQLVWFSGDKTGNFDDNDGNTGASFSSWNFTKDKDTFTNSSFASAGAGPQFDSDQTDMEFKMGQSTTVNHTHVHPKLPDFDDLSARFEALRSKR